MTLLGIETATAVCGAAVVVDGAVVAEESLEQHAVHAEKLLTLIDRALRGSGCSLSELDGIGVSIGPGSFTGLRIGLSVAKGLVYATGRRLVAVPTLVALAERVTQWGERPQGVPVLAALDARRDEIYAQLFLPEGDRLVPLWDARDCRVPDVDALLPAGSAIVTGDARQKVARFLEAIPARAQAISVAPDDIARCSAGAVASVGRRLLKDGEVADPATIEPRYIKEFFLKTR